VISGALHRSEVYKLEQYLPSQMICVDLRQSVVDLQCLGRPFVH